MEEAEHRYEVPILKRKERRRIPPHLKERLKAEGMMDEKGKMKIKGVSPKMLMRMKQEYVECPVLDQDIHFVQCFICPNFQSRIKGQGLLQGRPPRWETLARSRLRGGRLEAAPARIIPVLDWARPAHSCRPHPNPKAAAAGRKAAAVRSPPPLPRQLELPAAAMSENQGQSNAGHPSGRRWYGFAGRPCQRIKDVITRAPSRHHAACRAKPCSSELR